MLPTYYTQGGIRSYTVYSGTAGGHATITSGLGRLNQIVPINASLSGQAVFLYDGVAAVSGGPLPSSGHKVIGGIPAQPPLASSGTFNSAALVPIVFNTPFNSGLCITSTSGGPGLTVFYTNEPDREY